MKTFIPPPPPVCRIGAAIFLLFLASCQQPEFALEEPAADEALRTVLAKNKKTNPFTSANIERALKNLKDRETANGRRALACWECANPSTTHNYVRFAPQDVDQLITLHDYGYDLYDVPLDQEVVTQGEYYHDPSLPPDAITYQYTLVPDNYALPANVPYIILSQVFLFDEDSGDEADEWIPDPENCPNPYNPNCPCYEGPCARTTGDHTPTIRPDKREDLFRKATRTLVEAGINTRELYNEAMKLAGWEDEIIDESPANGRVNNIRYTPSGTVRVRDNVTGLDVPVKNVTVKTRRLFKVGRAITNEHGGFAINKNYRKKAHVILKFKNGDMTIRGISGLLKIWEYAQVLERECGLFEENNLVGLNINLGYQSNADTHAALQWAAAHCLNTYHEAKQYSAANNILQPYYDMNVWISSAVTQAASAPMLRAVARTSMVSQALNYLLPSTEATIKRIVQRWLPDVTLRIQGGGTTTRNADDLSNTFFHEFGHAQHYSQVGNGYWASYIAYIVDNLGYGNKTTSGAGRIAVGESWGFFIGNTFNAIKYNTAWPTRANADRIFLERQQSNDAVPVAPFNGLVSRGWIPFGLPHDLIDMGEPAITGINDAVSGYTIRGVFRGYVESATTVQGLKSAILSSNANGQATQVNSLVTSYGW